MGLCETGRRQSPINIVHNGNTIDDSNDYYFIQQNFIDSNIELLYEFPKEASYKKFLYDGIGLSMDINIGQLKYYNNDGTIEYYQSNKIELHFPAEHWVTMSHQTPRSSVELQIHHTKVKTEGEAQKTSDESSIRTNRAIISILFNVSQSEEGDMFFRRMGINKFNINNAGEFNLPKLNEELDRKGTIPASYPLGFNYLTFEGLIYALNADNHVFYYYGSETSPPCREDVFWTVFAKPRSISQEQFDYLNALITKKKNKAEGKKVSSHNQLYGNKRNIKYYDENIRGKILSSNNGLMAVTGITFFAENPYPIAE